MPPPVKKIQPRPSKLVRGEVAGLRLSGAERSLLQFAQDAFGEQLTQFLLSGLGEKPGTRWRLIVITFSGGDDGMIRRRLYVEADDLTPELQTSLPHGREPLVLLALLRLRARGRGTPPASLFYESEEVLGLLGWEGTDETQLALDDAVERYSCLTYRWALSRKELAAKGLSFYRSRERFISGYGLIDAEEGERVGNRVDFSPAFIDGLEHRSLFGVNWDTVRLPKTGQR